VKGPPETGGPFEIDQIVVFSCSQTTNVFCLVAFAPDTDVELHTLAIDERPAAGSLDVGVVDEYIAPVVILRDEAVALLCIEELDRSGCHFVYFLLWLLHGAFGRLSE
jgi:hypothetical protein